MYDTRVTSSHFIDKSYFLPPPPQKKKKKTPDVDSFHCFCPAKLKRLYKAKRTRFEFGALLIEKKFISPSVLFGFLKQSFPEDIIILVREKVLQVQRPASSNMLPI